jgi:hypothetical protein
LTPAAGGGNGNLVEALALLKLEQEFVEYFAAAFFCAGTAWMARRTRLAADEYVFGGTGHDGRD